jgi:hypothetical protein
MRRWIAVGALALAACQTKESRVEPSSGSATATPTIVADAQVIEAPKLAIACGPAMLAPRIPAPKPGQKQPSIDSIDGLLGVGVQQPIGTPNIANIGQGQGASVGRMTQSQPTMKFAATFTQGPIDKAIVDRMFKRSTAKFRHCYQLELQQDPTKQGTTTVQVLIDNKGKVKQANASGIGGPCIQTVIMAMGNFPPPADDGVTLAKLVLQFDPGDTTSEPFHDHYNKVGALAPKPKAKPVAKPPPIPDTRSWTPYAASLGLASDDVAQAAGAELVKRMPLPKLESCFAGKNASERTMVQVAFDGAVIGARSGGSGDAQVDACISTSLIGLKVTAPPTVTELACDIVRGDPQPWRVAPEGYTVIDVGENQITQSGTAFSKATLVPANADATHAFLIVADPAAPPAMVALAYERTQWSAATLVAVKTDPGPPVFIAMGRDGRTREKDYAPLLAIEHEKDSVKSCVDNQSRATSPKAEIETLLRTLANSCDPKPCPATLSIALSGTMQDLAAAADAARRAGLPRIGLSTTVCP